MASTSLTPKQRVDQQYPNYARTSANTSTKVFKWAFAFFAVAGGIGFAASLSVCGSLPIVAAASISSSIVIFSIVSTALFAYFVYRDDKRKSYQKALEKATGSEQKTAPRGREGGRQRRIEKASKKRVLGANPVSERGLLEASQLEYKIVDAEGLQYTDFEDASVDGSPQPLSLNDHPCPNIGQYNANGYKFSNTHLIVRLPKAHRQRLPKSLQKELKNIDDVDIFFTVQENPGFQSRKNQQDVQVLNTLYHGVVSPSFANYKQNISMGMFDWDPKQVGGIHVRSRRNGRQKDKLANNSFYKSLVYIHPSNQDDGMCLSPNNAQFVVESKHDVSTLCTAAIIPATTQRGKPRAVVMFTVLVNRPKASHGQAVLEGLTKTASLQQYVDYIAYKKVDQGVVTRVETILNTKALPVREQAQDSSGSFHSDSEDEESD